LEITSEFLLWATGNHRVLDGFEYDLCEEFLRTAEELPAVIGCSELQLEPYFGYFD
jgi:hypothetical protein